MDIKKFLEIENKYNLYHVDIDGINYWEYSRFEIWNYIFCTEKLSFQKAHRTQKQSHAIGLLGSMIKSAIRFYTSKQKNVDVCFITHERRVKENNYFDCMYTETLIKKYPNSVVLEKPYNYSHLQPIRTKNMYYTDWIIIFGNLYAKIHSVLKTRKYKQVYRQISEQLEKPFAEMKESYQLETCLDKLVRLNTERYFICKKQYKIYEKLVKKFSPKVVVEVCHYSRQCMLINEICNKMNIPTLELQHGTMHTEHAAYQYMAKDVISQLPTEILLFSDYWKTQINLPIKPEHLIATGFPYFESKVDEYKKQVNKDSRKTILFVSQGTIGKELSLLAVNLSRRLKLNEYRILYKLHPGEYEGWSKNYVELAQADIEVIAQSERGIYSYFAESDIQIGVYSTAIYEGIGFGLDTYIYNIGHADTMQSLVDGKYAQMFDTLDELLIYLKEPQDKKNGAVFWKKNALENQCNAINKYL